MKRRLRSGAPRGPPQNPATRRDYPRLIRAPGEPTAGTQTSWRCRHSRESSSPRSFSLLRRRMQGRRLSSGLQWSIDSSFCSCCREAVGAFPTPRSWESRPAKGVAERPLRLRRWCRKPGGSDGIHAHPKAGVPSGVSGTSCPTESSRCNAPARPAGGLALESTEFALGDQPHTHRLGRGSLARIPAVELSESVGSQP